MPDFERKNDTKKGIPLPWVLIAILLYILFQTAYIVFAKG